MARLPIVSEAQVSPALRSAYQKVVGIESALADTYQTLFNSPELASQLVGLHELVDDPATLEPWVRLTIALTAPKKGKVELCGSVSSHKPTSRTKGSRNRCYR